MGKLIGFRSRGHGKKRKAYPIHESAGVRYDQSSKGNPKAGDYYSHALEIQQKRSLHNPDKVSMQGFHHSISYSPANQKDLTRSLAYYRKKGYETRVVPEGNRLHLYYRKPEAPRVTPKPVRDPKKAYGRYASRENFYKKCRAIAKEHPSWGIAKVEAEATVQLSGIGEKRVTEKSMLTKITNVSSIKGMAHVEKDLGLETDIRGNLVESKERKILSKLIRKGEVYQPKHSYVKPTTEKPKREEKVEKPEKKRVKIPKKKRPPSLKMTHIEKMHLLAASKQFNVDPQEIDDTLTYYENKKHIQELAKMKGYSEHEITSVEQESEEWLSQYQGYLSHLRTELESAGYQVVDPKM